MTRREVHWCSLLLVIFAALGLSRTAEAQDATWLLNPGSGNFNTAANWSPATVPGDTAFFGVSNVTAISFSAPTFLNGLTFNLGASTYTLTSSGLGIFGAGIVVNGGSVTINTPTPGLNTVFFNSSSAGTANLNNTGGTTAFFNTSTAGSAIITNNGGVTLFEDSSNAGNATINNINGSTSFYQTSTGGTARLINGAAGSIDLSFNFSAGIATGSIEGAGQIFLGGKNLTVGGNNLSTDFAGNIQDGGPGGGFGGSLTKTGSGILSLSGNSSYTGATTVNSGVLVVNGSIATSALVTANAGGTLAGNGIVGNTTINGGTFAPGTSGIPGTSMTVAGNLAFQSAALYLVQLSSTTTSFANVTGTASLAGTVLASLAPGSFPSKQYVILQSAGLGGTKFDGVSTANLPGFAASLSYTPSSVLLNLTAALGVTSGLNSNQQNVATAINNVFNGGGTLPPRFMTIFGLSGNNLRTTLTQISGELATATRQTTYSAMDLFLNVMTDPFVGSRNDAPSGGGSTSYFIEDPLPFAQKRRPNDALAAIDSKGTQTSFSPSWRLWATGFGGSQTTDGNIALGSNNTSSRIYGVASGAEYRFSPQTIAGFSLAGGGTNFSVNNGGMGRSDLFQAGVFFRHQEGPAYFAAALGYGWQNVTTDRTVSVAGLDRLHSDFYASALSGRVEGGYRFVVPIFAGLGVTPYAAGQFVTLHVPEYTEATLAGTGAFALSYGSQDTTASRSELGFRTDKSFLISNGVMILRGRAAWTHDYDPNRTLTATFQTLPLVSFLVNGASQAAESALVTASAEMNWLNGWSAGVSFASEFSNVTRSYAGKGVVRYSW